MCVLCVLYVVILCEFGVVCFLFHMTVVFAFAFVYVVFVCCVQLSMLCCCCCLMGVVCFLCEFYMFCGFA